MRTIILGVFLLLAQISAAQENSEQKKPYNGVSWFDYFMPSISVEFQTLKNYSASIGIGAMSIPVPNNLKQWGGGLFLNNEFIFRNSNRDFVYSPQLSVFCEYSLQPDMPIALYGGVKLAYHTNFKNGGTVQFAPEIGIGYIFVFITYSRDISIYKNDLIPVNQNNINIKIIVPLEILHWF